MVKPFEKFKVWTVRNKLNLSVNNLHILFDEIKIKFPSRLNTIAINPSKIAFDNDGIYTPWEIVFSIKKYLNVYIKKINWNKVEISNNSKRKNLILHSFLLMKNVLNFKDNLYISVDNNDEIRHSWLWSSSKLISAVACWINELYWNPIPSKELIKYLAQNHWEEIDWTSNYLKPVQCIWWSAASWLCDSWLIILAWESEIIWKMDIDSSYDVIIWIPKDFKDIDSKFAFEEEIKNLDKFKNCWIKFWKEIAYNILHKLIPALYNNRIDIIWDIVFDYRFNKWSIENCSFIYPKLINLSLKLKFLKTSWLVDVISISSVWPTFFAITKKSKIVEKVFNENWFNIIKTKIENSKYEIEEIVSNNKKLWDNKKLIFEFKNKLPSKYVLDKIRIFETKSKILDLGCWWWRYSEILVKAGHFTYCIDISQEMIKSTKNRLIWFDKKLYNISKWNIINLKFWNNFFDWILCIWVLHQTLTNKDFTKGLLEINRILVIWWKCIIEIFTSDYIDNSIKNISWNLYIANNWLLMQLLYRDKIFEIIKNIWFEIDEKSIIQEIKNIWYWNRSILKFIIKKNENMSSMMNLT